MSKTSRLRARAERRRRKQKMFQQQKSLVRQAEELAAPSKPSWLAIALAWAAWLLAWPRKTWARYEMSRRRVVWVWQPWSHDTALWAEAVTLTSKFGAQFGVLFVPLAKRSEHPGRPVAIIIDGHNLSLFERDRLIAQVEPLNVRILMLTSEPGYLYDYPDALEQVVTRR